MIAVGGYLYLSGRASAAPAPSLTGAVMAPSDVLEIVRRVNDQEFGGWFNVTDVMAVIEIESSFRPGAYRAEPHLNDGSRGLMQILLSSARDRGFGGAPDDLFEPETNIRFGMRHLKWSHDFLSQRLGDVSLSAWIGSYNAGVGNALKGYFPTQYIAKFMAARAKWERA